MANIKPSSVKSNGLLTLALWLVGAVFALTALIIVTLVVQTPAGSSAAAFFQWLFAADSQQLMWYITRSAGLTGYLVLWLSVAWGLAVPSKILDRLLHRTFTYDFHQFISLLAIGFIALHMGVLLFDRYLPYTLPQILLPFLSPYRPVWVAFGVVAFWLIVLVTVTFYLRAKIGMRAFRAIHGLSLLAYLGVTVHGIFSGADSSLTAVLLMYVSTFLITIFLTIYWLLTKTPKRQVVKA